MVCLDTDIIIDFLRGEKEAINKLKKLRDNNFELSTTSINVFELFKGALRSNKSNSKDIVNNFLSNLHVFDFDINSSEKAAEIFEELRQKGELIDPLDLMIASIAISNNEILATNNLSHFKRISGLKIES
jgi:tRNA(fMet)-specific endonuclease VapC